MVAEFQQEHNRIDVVPVEALYGCQTDVQDAVATLGDSKGYKINHYDNGIKLSHLHFLKHIFLQISKDII